ncbi:MAG TPA: hypothetical protein VLN74_05345, partial [Ilumatobacteraceae bacterium]|nr:hypothetical protein [Ilumatobacteraceae bacterium]
MRSRKLFAACAALGLVAAACGSDDDTSSSATDGPDATEAPAPPDAPVDTEAPAATDAPEGTEATSDVPEDWPESIVFGFVPSQEQ